MTSQDPSAFRRPDRKDKKRFRTDATEVSGLAPRLLFQLVLTFFIPVCRNSLSSNHLLVQLPAIRCKSSLFLLHTHSSRAPSFHSLPLLQAPPLSIPPRPHSAASSLFITFRTTLCRPAQSTTRVQTTKCHVSLSAALNLWTWAFSSPSRPAHAPRAPGLSRDDGRWPWEFVLM